MDIEILKALRELNETIDEGLEPELAESVRVAILQILTDMN